METINDINEVVLFYFELQEWYDSEDLEAWGRGELDKSACKEIQSEVAMAELSPEEQNYLQDIASGNRVAA